MSDPAAPPDGGPVPVPVAPPAAVVPSAQPVAPAQPAPPVPAPAPDTAQVKMTSQQLKERLDEHGLAATRALLKEFGFENADAAKLALKKLGELETASLTEKEKLEKRIKELEGPAARASKVDGMLKGLVDAQFGELPEGVRKAIDTSANGDPDKRLEMMSLFRASGLLNQPAPVPAPAAPPPATPPASFAPSPAPAPSGAPTKYQEWESMKSRSPALGDFFYQQNAREIERSRPAS